MSQKNIKNYLMSQLFIGLLCCNSKKLIKLSTTVPSLERSKRGTQLNTGRFFKKIAFLSLAINELEDNKYRNLKLKSIINNLWNMIGAYNVIF